MDDPFPDLPFSVVEPENDDQSNKDVADILQLVRERSKRFESAVDQAKYMHGILALSLCFVLQQHSGPMGIVWAKAIMDGVLNAACREPAAL